MRFKGLNAALIVLSCLAIALACANGQAQEKPLDAITRLKPENLDKLHQAALALRAALQPVALDTGYKDFRAVMHAHSRLSHDSRGTPEEILDAAKRTGTRLVMMTEHPDPKFDWFKEGLSGLKEGVLFVPGAETSGLLVYPTSSLAGKSWANTQELAEIVKQNGGLAFLSHPEERLDLDIPSLTGMEIYNTHSDFLQQPQVGAHFAGALKSLDALMTLVSSVKQYPQEVIASLQTYPSAFIKRWDEINRSRRYAGIAANDSHNNVGFIATVAEGGKVNIDDPIGERLAEVSSKDIPALAAVIANKKVGDKVLELRLDPYWVSFGYVGTHVLMKELTHEQVWEALQHARCYLSFDWIADATGFAFVASDGDRKATIGDEIPLSKNLKLIAAAPLAGEMRLFRDGEMIAKQNANRLEFSPDKPGVYRVEVWLRPADDPRVWIISNPIFVR